VTDGYTSVQRSEKSLYGLRPKRDFFVQNSQILPTMKEYDEIAARKDTWG